MMTMYFLSTVSSEGTANATAEQSVENMKVLKDSYCKLMPDDRHRRHSVKTDRN